MQDLEITALPIAEAQTVAKMKTLGYDDQANAAQHADDDDNARRE